MSSQQEAQWVLGGVFLLVLLIFRMTHKLLQAIEIASKPVPPPSAS